MTGPTPLTMVGDDDAGVCVDGVCLVPQDTTSQDTSPGA